MWSWARAPLRLGSRGLGIHTLVAFPSVGAAIDAGRSWQCIAETIAGGLSGKTPPIASLQTDEDQYECGGILSAVQRLQNLGSEDLIPKLTKTTTRTFGPRSWWSYDAHTRHSTPPSVLREALHRCEDERLH